MSDHCPERGFFHKFDPKMGIPIIFNFKLIFLVFKRVEQDTILALRELGKDLKK